MPAWEIRLWKVWLRQTSRLGRGGWGRSVWEGKVERENLQDATGVEAYFEIVDKVFVLGDLLVVLRLLGCGLDYVHVEA